MLRRRARINMDKIQRFLVIYSAVVTVAFAASAVTRLHARLSSGDDEITVHRINVTEPDGTLRMVISNRASLPGVIVKGKETPPADRPQAGMIFYNDEASEIGGLIFGGRKDESGKVHDAGGSLSFDRYEANQIVQLMGVDDSENRIAGLIVSDSVPGTDSRRRIWIGRGDDGDATLALLDGNGRKRFSMTVAADGKTAITVLDENGKVVRDLLAAR